MELWRKRAQKTSCPSKQFNFWNFFKFSKSGKGDQVHSVLSGSASVVCSGAGGVPEQRKPVPCLISNPNPTVSSRQNGEISGLRVSFPCRVPLNHVVLVPPGVPHPVPQIIFPKMFTFCSLVPIPCPVR